MRETRLSDLKNGDRAKILRIEDSLPHDLTQRLRESGVTEGRTLTVTYHPPYGAALVRIEHAGSTVVAEFLSRGIVCERLDPTECGG